MTEVTRFREQHAVGTCQLPSAPLNDGSHDEESSGFACKFLASAVANGAALNSAGANPFESMMPRSTGALGGRSADFVAVLDSDSGSHRTG